MYKLAIKVAIVTMWLGTSGYAVAAGPGTPRFTPPVILSSTADLKDNVIVISGHDFGSTPPTVRLANQVLPVKSFSTTQIIASLPAGIQPATYSLTVSTTGPYQATSNPFNAAFFAAVGR
jgi:hypothetical protein